MPYGILNLGQSPDKIQLKNTFQISTEAQFQHSEGEEKEWCLMTMR